MLAQVRYRVTVALLLLRAGEGRFLPRVTDEVHAAIEQVEEIDLVRATTVAQLADALDVPDEGLTLAGIIAHAPAALASRLRDLQERLDDAVSDLQELTGAGTVVANAGLETVRRSLANWSGPRTAAARYGEAPPPAPSRFDGSF